MSDQRFYPPAHLAALDAEDSTFERSRVVILPVPYDSTVTGRGGARDGPRAIIDASADMELFDVGIGMEPWRHGIHTLPELAPHTGSPEALCARIEEVAGEIAHRMLNHRGVPRGQSGDAQRRAGRERLPPSVPPP